MTSRKRPNRFLDGGKQATPESLAAGMVPELSLPSPIPSVPIAFVNGNQVKVTYVR